MQCFAPSSKLRAKSRIVHRCSPFEWVPEQLSRFLTDQNNCNAFRASRAIINYVFRRKPNKSQIGVLYQGISLIDDTALTGWEHF